MGLVFFWFLSSGVHALGHRDVRIKHLRSLKPPSFPGVNLPAAVLAKMAPGAVHLAVALAALAPTVADLIGPMLRHEQDRRPRASQARLMGVSVWWLLCFVFVDYFCAKTSKTK